MDERSYVDISADISVDFKEPVEFHGIPGQDTVILHSTLEFKPFERGQRDFILNSFKGKCN